MHKPTLKNTLKIFDSLGTIKSRSMFGGFGIFCDDTMFALVVNDRLHLRAGKQNEKEFKQLNMVPYTYKKRGFPVITKYFEIPANWWEEEEILIGFSLRALEIAKSDQSVKKTSVATRIKDLPNLRLANERMLKKVGIDSVEKLQKEGAVRAFQALQNNTSSSLSLDMLWALEGAIDGRHWSVITPQRRNELLTSLDQ